MELGREGEIKGMDAEGGNEDVRGGGREGPNRQAITRHRTAYHALEVLICISAQSSAMSQWELGAFAAHATGC
jgi:hypothetical protein